MPLFDKLAAKFRDFEKSGTRMGHNGIHGDPGVNVSV